MMESIIKKICSTVIIGMLFLPVSITSGVFLLKYCAHKESIEDDIQREQIGKILEESADISKILEFKRSRENRYRYYLRLMLNDGTKLILYDVYASKETLYGEIFRFGDFTMPRLLVYNGETVLTENYLFTDISDLDIIAIYHHNNLSRLFEQKEKMRNFLARFPVLDEEAQKKLGGNRDSYSELIQEFNLAAGSKKWVVLTADTLFPFD